MSDEKDLYVANPAMFRDNPLQYFLAIAVTVAGVVLAIWRQEWYWLILTAVGLCYMLVWYLKILGTTLTVTNKRTILRRGILSRSTNEVLHTNVKNIQVDQSFAQRIFGVGTVGISSSGQSGVEIQVSGVPRPDEIRKLIDENRKF